MQYEPGLIWTHWNQPHLALIRKVRLEFSAWLRVWKSCSRVTATASDADAVRDAPLRDGPARRATATRSKIWHDGADQDRVIVVVWRTTRDKQHGGADRDRAGADMAEGYR